MNSSTNWDLQVDAIVYKELKRFPRKDALRILELIANPYFDPYGGDIEKIKGEKDVWRKRIGAYRIFYEVNQSKRLVHIFWTERRDSKTY